MAGILIRRGEERQTQEEKGSDGEVEIGVVLGKQEAPRIVTTPGAGTAAGNGSPLRAQGRNHAAHAWISPSKLQKRERINSCSF